MPRISQYIDIQEWQTLLLHWHRYDNKRTMPWKQIKNPYHIWLSEIILQQTRVEQGTKYYLAFIKTYPTIIDLAKAKDNDVFKLWEGLGYYNRCKHLLETARIIAKDFQGMFPNNYETILSLKGIGHYTAAAIASFAFNLPYSVVDGNVIRIISRITNYQQPIDTTKGKKTITEWAHQLLLKNQSSLYNQAIMDMGATLCTPLKPRCIECFFNHYCQAYKKKTTHLIPIKAKTKKTCERKLVFAVLQYKHRIWIQKRTHKDIWNGLFQFYLIEDSLKKEENILPTAIQQIIKKNNTSTTQQYKQQLTHQIITASFLHIAIPHPIKIEQPGQWHFLREIKKLSFPKIINNYLQDHIFANKQ